MNLFTTCYARICGLFVFINLLALNSYCQTDTKFWFAVPEFADNGVTVPTNAFDRPISLVITAFSQPATVTITQPAGGAMPPQTFTVPANSNQSLNLTPWIENLECKPADQVLNYGLYISSTALITASYVQASTYNPEIFTLKGKSALGTNFWIPGQNIANNATGYTPIAQNSFDIVATENNTTVTITPIKNIIGHSAGVPYTVVLNMGQTYSAVATSQVATDHLVGSRVTSDKPIAITVKEDEITGAAQWAGGCQDGMGEQIVPIDNLGTDYVAIKSKLLGQGDYIFITATQNNTTFSVNGVAVATTLNAGQTYSMTMPTSSVYIKASLPVTIWQISGIGCEVGGTNLPQIECSGSTSVSYTRTSDQLLVFNLLVPDGGQGDFRINGTTGIITAGQFTAVPGTGGQWYAAQVDMPLGTYPVNTTISVTNTSKFHMSVMEGSATIGSTYGYYSDYNGVPANAYTDLTQNKTDTLCLGSTIHLYAGAVVGATYDWSGPNGFSSTQQNPVISNADLAASGKYTLTVTKNGCSNIDSAIVQIVEIPAPPVVKNDTLCTGQPANVPVVTGDNILWYTAASGGTGSGVPPVITTTTAGISTFYVSQTSKYGCESARTPIQIVVIQAFDLTPMTDTFICSGTGAQLNTSGAISYLWIPSTNLSCDTCPNPIATPSQTTKYTVIGYDGIVCFDTASVTVTIVNPVASFDIDKHNFCETDSLIVRNTSQGTNLSYRWDFGDGDTSVLSDPTHPYVSPGTYYISLAVTQNIVCHDTATDTVVVDTAGTFIHFITDSTLCVGKAATFIPQYGPGTSSIIWTFSDIPDSVRSYSPRHLFEHSGSITITITGKYRTCPDISYSKAVNIFPYPLVNIGTDTSLCPGQPSITIVNLNAEPDGYTDLWSTGAATRSINANTPGTYWLTVTSGHGCTTTDTMEVFNDCYLHIPNAFTPNGDDVNDYFFPKEILSKGATSFHMQLFNRWGMQVFETSSTTGRGWDGRLNGTPQPEGVYVYLIDVVYKNGNSEKYKGNVTLLR